MNLNGTCVIEGDFLGVVGSEPEKELERRPYNILHDVSARVECHLYSANLSLCLSSVNKIGISSYKAIQLKI